MNSKVIVDILLHRIERLSENKQIISNHRDKVMEKERFYENRCTTMQKLFSALQVVVFQREGLSSDDKLKEISKILTTYFHEVDNE